MSDQSLVSHNTDSEVQLPPPSGDSEKADKYISQLIELISTDKLIVSHTDLSKFDPTSLQDHYSLDLKNYEIEVSHNKQAETGKDFYIILFNNLKLVNESFTEKIILAYMHLTQGQFDSFKSACEDQLERKRKAEEEKRFSEAMTPIDQILGDLNQKHQEEAEPGKDDLLQAEALDTSHITPDFAATT